MRLTGGNEMGDALRRKVAAVCYMRFKGVITAWNYVFSMDRWVQHFEKRKADTTAASSQLENAITALATGSCGAGREEQKKKRSGKINASDVFRKYAGNATHESYIAQLQEDDDVAQARVEAVWEELGIRSEVRLQPAESRADEGPADQQVQAAELENELTEES